MEKRCPNCGAMVVMRGLGRKRLPIPFNNISNVLQWHSRGFWRGKPHFLNTAKKILELYDIEVTAGFVQLRLQEEAAQQGKTYDELIGQIMTKGKRNAKVV